MLKTRKFMSWLLAFCLCFAMAMPAFATDSQSNFPDDDEMARLLDIAKSVEIGKDTWTNDSADIDFSKLAVGQKVKFYNFTDNGFEENGAGYPIIYNDKLFMLAIQNSDGGFSTAGTKIEQLISDCVNIDSEFVFVYDSTTCYLFDGNNWTKLYQYPEDNTRATLNTNARMDTTNLEMASIKETVPLNYDIAEALNDERAVYWELPIRGVYQDTDNICWAASCATIINYLKGTSLTSTSVAKALLGNEYDQGQSPKIAPTVLAMYGINNYSNGSSPSGTVIANNLARNYPVYSNFRSPSLIHVLVVYYIDGNLTTIKAFDPDAGNRTIGYNSNSGVFEYSYGGSSMKMYTSACPIWS